MNIECSQELLNELESAFRFNDAVLRHLTLSCKAAITEQSAMMVEVEREESAKTANHKSAPKDDDESDSDAEIMVAVVEGDEAEISAAAEESDEADTITDTAVGDIAESITDAAEGDEVETNTDAQEVEAVKTKTVEEGVE